MASKKATGKQKNVFALSKQARFQVPVADKKGLLSAKDRLVRLQYNQKLITEIDKNALISGLKFCILLRWGVFYY